MSREIAGFVALIGVALLPLLLFLLAILSAAMSK